MTVFDFAVTGRAVWDEWACDPALLRPDGIDNFGGSGANIASAIAHATGSCTFASVFGSDAASSSYLRYLSAFVDVSLSARRHGPLPRCAITPGKTFQWINRELDSLYGGELRIADAMASARAIVLVEPHLYYDFSSCRLPLYWSPQLALRHCKEQTVQLLDSPWSAVFLNANEAQELSRISKRSILSLSRENPACCWIVTNGADPTAVHCNGDKMLYQTIESDKHYPVGCGDAFVAGFCVGHFSNWGVNKAVELGHILAHEVLAQVGSQLGRDSVLSALERVRPGQVE